MRRLVVVSLLAAALLGGCGSSHRRSLTVAGGCGITTVHRGSGPAWAAHSNPPGATPYAVATGGTVAAFIFGYPLRAGNPTNPRNKILWIVRQPGAGLVVRASPLRSAKPVVMVRLDDSAGPVNYPSYVNVPRPGCWHMALRWAGHTDSLDLAYGTAG